MLRVNQLSGFGGAFGGPEIVIFDGTASNTNSPSWTINLGPPGPKQVMVAFACFDTVGNDPWDWATGSIGADAFTYAPTDTRAGDGASATGGATIRTVQTFLSGDQTLAIQINNFGGTMNSYRFLAFVTRGFSPTPISFDAGQNQDAFPEGRDCTLNTSGARLVIVCAEAHLTAPGNLQGPGSEVTVGTGSNTAVGYDLAPAGGASDVYTFSGTTYVIAGAAFA